jgi:hypothetical protein
MAIYESEHTQFMREMMAKNPEWAAGQLEGMARLWDKKATSLPEQEKIRESSEATRPYPYDVNFE